MPNRKLANTNFPFILNLQSNLQELSNIRNQQIDIKINSSRGWLMSFSPNNSRKLFILSNVSSVAYTNRVQALNNCLTYAEQVKSVELQCSPPALSYTIVREGMNAATNKISVVEIIYISYATNICVLQGQITSVIEQATLAIYC